MPRLGQVLKPLVRLGRSPEACWEWLGSTRAKDGLAIKQFAGRNVPARRWIWEQLFGPIPDGHVISQACGNQSCINPHHLKKYGSFADALRAGASATITAADIPAIRAAKGKVKAEVLADELGVSKQTIRDIWRGDTWASRPRHLTATTPSRNLLSLEQPA